jgi:hypothetical protein
VEATGKNLDFKTLAESWRKTPFWPTNINLTPPLARKLSEPTLKALFEHWFKIKKDLKKTFEEAGNSPSAASSAPVTPRTRPAPRTAAAAVAAA